MCQLLTIKEAAGKLGIAEMTLRTHWIPKGQIKTTKLNKNMVRIARSEVDRILTSKRDHFQKLLDQL